MIKRDDEIRERLCKEAVACGDPAMAEAMIEVSNVMKHLGLKGLVLPDGSRALGHPFGDGTWHVLQTASRDIVPSVSGRGATEWLAGRLDEATGTGFMTGEASTLGEAFTEMVRMPSPVVDGEVIDAVVACSEEANALVAEASASAPVAGM